MTGTDLSNRDAVNPLLETARMDDAKSLHEKWNGFRETRKSVKILATMLENNKNLFEGIDFGEIFTGIDKAFEGDAFALVRDTLGTLVSVHACFRNLRPGETRLAVASKGWAGKEHEKMVLPKNLEDALCELAGAKKKRDGKDSGGGGEDGEEDADEEEEEEEEEDRSSQEEDQEDEDGGM